MPDDIVSLYESTSHGPLPPDPDTIVAVSIPSAPAYYVGRTHAGQTCALIQTRADSSGPDIRLRNLEVRQGIRSRILGPEDGEEEIKGCLLVCLATEASMRALFLRLVQESVEQLGQTPEAHKLSLWIHELSALFSHLEIVGRKKLRGIWAELLVIKESGDCTLMLRHWHANPDERLDFVSHHFAIEVKSCQDLERVHEFSLTQLRPPADLATWIASVPVRQDPCGTSTLDLLEEVERLLPTAETRATARRIVFAAAGKSLEEDKLHTFDIDTASRGMRFIDARSIPSPDWCLPSGVLQVKLTVRCRDIPTVGTPSDALARMKS